MTIHNLLVYNLQILVLIAIVGVTMALLRILSPKARLHSLEGLLTLSLLLPFLQPRIPVKATVTAVTGEMFTFASQTPAPNPWTLPSWTNILAIVLIAGISLRLVWVAAGLFRLARLRAQATPLPRAYRHLCEHVGANAEFYLSSEVSGPVTFGFVNPAVVLPLSYANDFAVCHELLHIRRRDWLVALLEQIVLSLFWFNPAIWWLMNRLQLTREQVVDRQVVAILENRDEYLHTLLSFASVRQSARLTPANLFLEKRHLRQRVAALLQEVSMSRSRLFSSAAALSATAALTVFLCFRTLPLQAAPQMSDSNYIEIRTPNAKLLHRTPVAYPETAREKQIQGEVTAEVTLNSQGEVSDAHIISGPEELRAPTLHSVLGWHFDRSASPASFQIAVAFKALPANGTPVHRSFWPGDVPMNQSLTVSALDVKVPPALADRVNPALTIHQGQSITASDVSNLADAMRQVDEHLQVSVTHSGNGSANVRISVPGYGPQRIRVGGNVQQANILQRVVPTYPLDAKAAHVQGTVRLEALIGRDGHIESLTLLSGDPLLTPAAIEAVRQWVYKPTLLNGDPVDVVTNIDVNFTLTQ